MNSRNLSYKSAKKKGFTLTSTTNWIKNREVPTLAVTESYVYSYVQIVCGRSPRLLHDALLHLELYLRTNQRMSIQILTRLFLLRTLSDGTRLLLDEASSRICFALSVHSLIAVVSKANITINVIKLDT